MKDTVKSILTFITSEYQVGEFDDGISMNDSEWKNAFNGILASDDAAKNPSALEALYKRAFDLCEQNPESLLPYFVIAQIKNIQGEYKDSRLWNQCGFELACSKIPDDYIGRIPLGRPSNKLFGYLLGQRVEIFMDALEDAFYEDIDQEIMTDWRQKIIKTIEIIMQCDPDAGELFQHVLGLLLVLDGQYEAAKSYLMVDKTSFRSMYINAAIAIKQQNYAQALMYFRRGMLINHYFGAFISGEPSENPPRCLVHFASNDQETFEQAQMAYNTMDATLWFEENEYLFATWAREHSLTLTDRAAYQLLKETQGFESSEDAVAELNQQLVGLQDMVTLDQCERAVGRVKYKGVSYYPWQCVALQDE